MQEMQGWNTARLPAFLYIGKVSLVKIIYFIRSNNVAGRGRGGKVNLQIQEAFFRSGKVANVTAKFKLTAWLNELWIP